MTAYNQHYKASLTGLTQANGAKSLDVSGSAKTDFVIFVVPSGTVTAGTLTVGIKTKEVPDSDDHQDLTSTIDFTDPAPMKITSVALKSLEFTPTSFDGDSYSVYVTGV